MFLVAARFWRMALPVLLAVGVALHPARAQDDAGQVVMIPMRDGARLRVAGESTVM